MIEFAPIFNNAYIDILSLLGEGMFGDVDLEGLANEGVEIHNKVYRYLYKHFIECEDIDL